MADYFVAYDRFNFLELLKYCRIAVTLLCYYICALVPVDLGLLHHHTTLSQGPQSKFCQCNRATQRLPG